MIVTATRCTLLTGIALWLVACSGSGELPEETRVVADWRAVVDARDADQPLSYRDDVQPILEQRCIVCHGCYDAPCQLKLSSYDGVTRGASPERVYDGARIRAAEPTRLGIDARSESEWREKGFHTVLGGAGRADISAEQRVSESVLYRMLRLKQLNPQPRAGLLPDVYTLGLDREQACTSAEGMAKFERSNPYWGMPYAMPNLDDAEYRTLVRWIAEGAQGPKAPALSDDITTQVVEWESFLNGPDNKQQLMSRYLYEHLFLGHLHFAGDSERNFFKLVRSFTPPGQPIEEVPAVRPFWDAGAPFWYRLRLLDEAIVAKSHVVYELSNERMARYRELFLEPDYTVTELPGYALPDAANPFITFAAIPPVSRYQFMLDEARFFIQGFIKGPVCRGQVALNVIEDHFWVMFANPGHIGAEDSAQLLLESAHYLQMPSDINSLNLFATFNGFWELQKSYLRKKFDFIHTELSAFDQNPMTLIWNGDGANPNAALTVFRNFDSAAVEFGFVGDYPETAWVIDYPLLERIHYLLVANFDVYGNVGHQLNTRLFMDFLRMEGEDNFLTFLPPEERVRVRDDWYQGVRSKRQKLFEEPIDWLTLELPISYQSDDLQQELYSLIEQRLGSLAGSDDLNRCAADCDAAAGGRAFESDLRRLSEIGGEGADIFPDVSFIRIQGRDGEDFAYTLVLNKSYANLSSIFSDGNSDNRDQSNDSISLLRGFSGSYPNFFFVVPESRVAEFVTEAASVQTSADYQAFVTRFGVRRTQADFWQQADWFRERYAALAPVEAGIFDLNRYQNR